MLDRLKGQLLTVGILIAILLAYVLPYLGATGGPLKTEITTKVAIAIIFFLLVCPMEQIIESCANTLSGCSFSY